MSVNMPEDSNVFSMLEMSVRNQREQSNAITMMFEAVRKVHRDVEETAERVAQSENRIQALAEKVEDQIRLLPQEIDDLYQAVVSRSILLAKSEVSEENDKFTIRVGRIRRKIWSETKKRFGVSKYIHIRRKDYEEAMSFVNRFNLGDYV